MNATKIERILKYIKDNPNCTSSDISIYFEITEQTTRKYIRHIKNIGHIINVGATCTFGKGRPFETYSIIEG